MIIPHFAATMQRIHPREPRETHYDSVGKVFKSARDWEGGRQDRRRSRTDDIEVVVKSEEEQDLLFNSRE